MIKITYRESSIECSTQDEMRSVLEVLNEIRQKNAKEKSVGLQVNVALDKRELRSASLQPRAPKPKVH
jgi:hypothetical protein